MSEKVNNLIVDLLLEKLEQGVVPWRCPFLTLTPRSLVTKKPYRGVNILLLGMRGYASPYWLTPRQLKDKGGTYKEGEAGKYTPILFSGFFRKDPVTGKLVNAGKDDKGAFFLNKFYKGYNVEQCEGLEVPPIDDKVGDFSPIEECEHIVSGYVGAPPIKEGGSRACYIPSEDRICMPPKENFSKTEEYYSTLFHEMTHSSGAAHRLNRKGITDPIKFASHNYSYEELVAECGASFLCGHAGIHTATLDNSAAYIGNWLGKLKSEKKWLLDAAREAMRATDHILGVDHTKLVVEDDD